MARISGDKASFIKRSKSEWNSYEEEAEGEQVKHIWQAFHKEDEEVHNDVVVTESGRILWGDLWAGDFTVLKEPDTQSRRRVPTSGGSASKGKRKACKIMRKAAKEYDNSDYWNIGTAVKRVANEV